MHQLSSSSYRAPVGGSVTTTRLNCCCSLRFHTVFALFILVFCWQAAFVDAKRGCANFGHSCYGGMGKRAEYVGEEMVGLQDIQGNPMLFIQPRSENPSLSTHRLFPLNVRTDKLGASSKGRLPLVLQQLLYFYRNEGQKPANNIVNE